MKHSFLSYVLAALMAIICLNVSAYDFIIDGICYNFIGEEYTEVEVAKGYEGECVIPESVVYKGRTLSVTKIGDRAFKNFEDLSSIAIPYSVYFIGNYAFEGCSGLTSINIPNSVIIIGTSAFSNCSGLTSINIPNSVRIIGDGAFQDCI